MQSVRYFIESHCLFKLISVKKNNMYFDTQRAKVYKDSYRPSSNIYRFFKCLMSVIVDGHSPSGSYIHYRQKRK